MPLDCICVTAAALLCRSPNKLAYSSAFNSNSLQLRSQLCYGCNCCLISPCIRVLPARNKDTPAYKGVQFVPICLYIKAFCAEWSKAAKPTLQDHLINYFFFFCRQMQRYPHRWRWRLFLLGEGWKGEELLCRGSCSLLLVFQHDVQ